MLLIYGSRGWIGSMFTSYLREQGVQFIEGEARVDNTKELIKELDTVKPTHVCSFVGRTSGVHNGTKFNTIDYLEQPGCLKVNIRDNLFSPVSLAILCRERNIHLTYLGTGCIFNYDDTHNTKTGFKVDDLPNFFGSSYSTVKGYTDQLMHLFSDTALNLRIRMPITNQDSPKNFISKIIHYNKICSIPNSMTVLTDFFPVWLRFIKERKTGTVNCTNPGVISHNEILTMYKRIVDPSFEWENFTIEEQRLVIASERSNNYLETQDIVPDIHTSVERVLRGWIYPSD